MIKQVTAFPVKAEPYSRDDQAGMTLRDYFAAKAMQGLLASPRTPTKDEVVTDTIVAKYAYLMADAMLKAREQ